METRLASCPSQSILEAEDVGFREDGFHCTACSWSCAQTREATTPWRSTSLQILDWPTGIMVDDGRCSHETWGKPLEPPEVPEDLDMGDCMRPFLYQREEEQEGWTWSAGKPWSKAADVSQRLKGFLYRCKNRSAACAVDLFSCVGLSAQGAPFSDPTPSRALAENRCVLCGPFCHRPLCLLPAHPLQIDFFVCFAER